MRIPIYVACSVWSTMLEFNYTNKKNICVHHSQWRNIHHSQPTYIIHKQHILPTKNIHHSPRTFITHHAHSSLITHIHHTPRTPITHNAHPSLITHIHHSLRTHITHYAHSSLTITSITRSLAKTAVRTARGKQSRNQNTSFIFFEWWNCLIKTDYTSKRNRARLNWL